MTNMGSTNIQTAIRVRPLIEREKKEKLDAIWLVKENSIVQIDSYKNFMGEAYSFDHIFDHMKSNKDVYESVVKPLVMSCLEGIHATIFAYGQTSSGKTHTMLGDKKIPGIISHAIEDIFSYIHETSTKDFLLRCSYLEIYNEKINDLLDTNATDIKIREDYNGGVIVAATEEVIRAPSELFNIMKKGMKTRKIGCTDMNERSSRSHTIFKVIIHSQKKGESEVSKTTESILSLVDLAGSERVGQMNMGGVRQVEGVSINKSLTTLGLVIRKLSENEPYINYRDSKLTRLLQDSLGGNSKTLIIATVTVAAEETKSTLEFAQRAKKVKNRPIINERVADKDQLKQYEHLCQQYKKEVEKLWREKTERDKTIEVLEGKIGNIKLFTTGNDVRPLSKIPSRRHTMGFYKSHAKAAMPRLSEELFEPDEFIKPLVLSPVKSEMSFRIADDKENSITQSPPVSPISCTEFEFPEPPKTPYSSLRNAKVLLDESYESLKEFTRWEDLLQVKEDLLKLIENLRGENCKLQQEKLNVEKATREDFRYLLDQLNHLDNILKPEEKPLPSKRISLTTILEEELELFNDNIENSDNSIDSDSLNSKEDEEVSKLKLLVEQLRFDLLNNETELTVITEKLKNVLNETCQKDEMIEKLQSRLNQVRDVKEVELEILNNKIIKSNQYKETMHTEIEKLKSQNEGLQNEFHMSGKNLDDFNSIIEDLRSELAAKESKVSDLQNINEALELQVKKDISELQLYDSLNHQIDQLKSECVTKDNQVEKLQKLNRDLNEKNVLLTENVQEIEKLESELRDEKSQIQKLKSDLEDAQFQLAGEQQELKRTSRELDFGKQHIKDLEAAILALEIKLTNSTFEHQDFVSLKHQMDLLISEGVNKDKEVGLLQKSNDELNGKMYSLEEKERQIEHLNSELKKLEFELEDAQFQLTGEQQELETTSQQLESAKQQIKVLRAEVVALETELTNSNSRIQDYDSLKHQLELLKSESVYKDEQIDAFQKSHNALNEKIAKLARKEQEIQQLNSKLLEQKALLKKLESDLEDAYSLMTSKQHELERSVEDLESAKQQIKDFETKVVTLESDLLRSTFQTQEYESLKTELYQLKSDSISKDNETNMLQKSNQDLIDQLKEHNRCNDQVKELGDEISQLVCQNLSKDTEIYNLKSTVNGLLEKNSLLEEKMENIQSQLLEKTHKFDLLKSEIHKFDVLQTSNNDLNEKMSTMAEREQRIEQLNSELCEQKSQVEKLKSNLENTQLQLCVNQLELERTSQELTSAKQQIQNFKEKVVTLETELSKSISNINDYDSLKYEIDLLKSDVVDKDKEIGILQKSNGDLNERIIKLAEKEIEMSGKQQELERINQELEEKVHNMASLEGTIVTLKSSREESIKEVLHLKSKLAQTESDLETKNSKQLKDIENDKRLSESEYARHEKVKKEYKCELSKLQDLLVAKERDLANKVKENESLAKANLNLSQKIRDLEGEINDHKTKDQENYKDTREVDALKLQLRGLEAEINEKKRLAQNAREDYLALKRTYNSLEDKFFCSKKELADQKRLSAKNEKTLEIIKNVMEKNDFGLKYMPFEQQLTELILKLKGLSEDLAGARSEVRLKSRELSAAQAVLSKISLQHQSCTKTIDNLNREKNDVQLRLGATENVLATEHKCCTIKAEELVQSDKRCKDLQEKLNLQKDKVISLTEKLKSKEREVLILEGKVGELLQFKKTVQDSQDKIVVPRRSDDSSRSMSPNEVRRIKRQSLHDQRRGINPDIGSSDDESNSGCETCAKLKTKMLYYKGVNEILKDQMGELSSDIRDLDKENEDLENIIKTKDKRIESQEQENVDLKNTNLLLMKQTSFKENISTEEKSVQVEGSSDFHEKLMKYKYLAITRREEANFLRSKLGLPLDCSVLPANAQVQKKS